jgi:CrcB protein
MPLWQKLAIFAVLGSLGTLARFGLAELVKAKIGADFPVSTLVVNLLGCFAFGLVLQMGRQHDWLGTDAAQIVLIGFMGAFTTFSSFAYDNVVLLEQQRYSALIANLTLQNGLGIAALVLGSALARLAG